MKTFVLSVVVPNAFQTTLSGNAKEKLKDFVKSCQFRNDGIGRVWLTDTPRCDVSLLLPDTVIDSLTLDGENLYSDSTVLSVSVVCDSAEVAYDVLQGNFLQDGQDRVYFPAASMQPKTALSKWGRVTACRIDLKKYGKADKTKVGDNATLEYMTVYLPATECSPASAWKEASEANFNYRGCSESARTVYASDGGMGEGLSLLEERLSELLIGEGDDKKFDPLTILLIISAIIPLIQNCFLKSPETLKRKLGNRLPLAASLRGKIPGLSWAKAMRLSDQIFDKAKVASDGDLKKLIRDCEEQD